MLADYHVHIPPGVADRYPLTKGKRFVLVDTPGFDNVSLSDTEVLRRLAVWLASAYNAGMKVGGIVYMYPIYPGRITWNDCANIKVFQKICGVGGLSKVTLATTRWSSCRLQSGESREQEIWRSFWDGRTDAPAQSTMARLEDSRQSAWAIMESIFKTMKGDGVVLALQRQLVDKGRIFQQTDAAQELRAKILRLLKDIMGGDPSPAVKKRLEELSAEAKALKIPMSKRIQALFSIIT
ncbi:hypothetical protein EST38_g11994 [Candolleomyces aberdarensis]|uniref:G domain-containing protein n=1 Tax=Candolleomyces aberdarensis TaxID=2316362 RepID=A0A4Q2D522_9AGAR|nr:hypothetical protein EST38_g11994 [Candolleomyces aberdarensis]